MGSVPSKSRPILREARAVIVTIATIAPRIISTPGVAPTQSDVFSSTLEVQPIIKDNTMITSPTIILLVVSVCVRAFFESRYRDSGYLVSVARLLVYMWPPTSMCTGALVLVSWAGVGMPPEPRGEAGETETRGRLVMLPLLLRLSCETEKQTRPRQKS